MRELICGDVVHGWRNKLVSVLLRGKSLGLVERDLKLPRSILPQRHFRAKIISEL